MDRFLEFLDYQDFSAVFLALFLITFVGRMIASDDLRVHTWSNRFAALAMLVHAGLLTVQWRPDGAAAVASIVFRAIITGAFALGMFQIIITVILSMQKLVVGPAVSKCLSDVRSWRHEKQQRRSQRQADIARQQEQLEWERRAPERQRAQLESEANAHREAEAAAARAELGRRDQRRREDARAACECLYALYRPDMRSRFSQKQFDDFIARYLSDKQTPEYVEQRAEQLKGVIHANFEKAHPTPRFKTFADISAYYEDQKRQILAIPNESLRDEMLARLEDQYDQINRRFAEEMGR